MASGVTVDSNLNLEPLEELMRIISNDEVTMGFFAKIPGFTYQYARYTDWIGQYLEAITEIDKNNDKAMTKSQKQDLKTINILYARYENFIKHGPVLAEPEAAAENVEMINTQANEVTIAPIMQYMLLKAEKEVDSGVSIDSNGLLLSASSI